MRTNVLARIFDWLGEALERFNPSAFRFLAAVLPYLSPVPVAWLTARSASEFLSFTPEVAFIFVFTLEGIGLWFTTMLVDSIVDFVRSRNWKTLIIVLMFVVTVGAYINILINLNVTLKAAYGSENPALSKVITLMCLLPLITGVGNGYYKVKIESKTEVEHARLHQEEIDAKIREEKASERIQKYKIKHETSGSINGNSRSSFESNMKVPKRNGSSETISGSMGRPSIHEERVFSYLEEAYSRNGSVPTFTEVARDLNLPQSTASRLRNKWLGKSGG